MRRLFLVFLLLVFFIYYTPPTAYCENSIIEYQMVMFKCGVKSDGATAPNVSVNLEKLCISSYFAYKNNSAYVFAIVPINLSLTLLAITNFLLPLSQSEELEFKSIIDMTKIELDYCNGVKARPTPNMSQALN